MKGAGQMRGVLTAAAVLVGALCYAGETGKEAVTLVTADGAKVAGYFVKGRGEKTAAVVLLHRFGGSKEDWNSITEKYLSEPTGYAILAIDLRGHGETLLMDEKGKRTGQFGEEGFGEMTRDTEAAVKWLRAREDIDGDRIAIVGADIGANVALEYATGDSGIKCIGLLSPGITYKGIKALARAKEYGARPMLLAASREDAQAAKSIRGLAEASAGEEVILVFDGNLHGTKMFGRVAIDGPLTAFLKENLEPATAKEPQAK